MTHQLDRYQETLDRLYSLCHRMAKSVLNLAPCRKKDRYKLQTLLLEYKRGFWLHNTSILF